MLTNCSDLEEMDIGDWTLKPILEIFGPGKVEKFDFETKPPNGESFHEVVKRVGRFVEESILEQIHRVEMSKPEPKQKITIAVYAHGMVLKAFFKYLTEYQTSQLFSFPIKNTAVMHFLYQYVIPFLWTKLGVESVDLSMCGPLTNSTPPPTLKWTSLNLTCEATHKTCF